MACLIVVLLLSADTKESCAETWTNLGGDRSIQAKMIGMWNNQVVLQLADGRSVNVPMDKLIAASRIQAGKIAEQLKEDRTRLTDEIKAAAAQAAAAAPDPLPVPPAAPAYQAPAPGMSPDQVLESVREQFQNGHLVVIYDALPPKYRKQLDDLVGLTLTKLDPNTLIAPLEQLHGLADLIVTRQNWILSQPRLHRDADANADLNATGELVEQFLLPAAGLVRAALVTDQAGLIEIQEMGFGNWLHQNDEIVSPFAAVLLEGFSSPGSQWAVVESDEETALLQEPGAAGASTTGAGDPYGSSYPGQNNASSIPTVAFQKVDGYWLPAGVAEGFEGWVQEQTAALEKYDDASMTLTDWLGGQFVSVPTVTRAPAAETRSDYPGSDYPGSDYPGSEGYDDQYGSPSSSESYESAGYPSTSSSYGPPDSPEMSSYGSTESYGTSERYGGAPAKELEPIAITPAMVGSILQSVGDYGSMFRPLEAAEDEASFHAAVDQLVGSIEGLVSLIP
ncbi:hypothetical protein [Allorhodopirellula solitaria]|nr:hypothetical protein [Allorhodopirellula solitaria]